MDHIIHDGAGTTTSPAAPVMTSQRLPWRCIALVVGMVLVGLLPLSAAAAARPATEAVTPVAPGMVTLYAVRDAVVANVAYTACGSPVKRPLPKATFTKFAHTSRPGCQALLVNKEGRQFRLCEGRGTIPVAFQQSRHLLIQSGSTPRCL